MLENLGCLVSGGPSKAQILLAFGDFASEPEVAELNIPVVVHEDVLRLEVPIHHSFAMQVLYSQNDASEYEPGPFFSGLLE